MSSNNSHYNISYKTSPRSTSSRRGKSFPTKKSRASTSSRSFSSRRGKSAPTKKSRSFSSFRSSSSRRGSLLKSIKHKRMSRRHSVPVNFNKLKVKYNSLDPSPLKLIKEPLISKQNEEEIIEKKVNMTKTRNKFLKQFASTDRNLHLVYIVSLLKLAQNLDKNYGRYLYRKFNFDGIEYELKKYNTLDGQAGYNLSLMGGVQFFLIYYEAIKMGIINPNDVKMKKTIDNFLKYKTTDIDVQYNFMVEPEYNGENTDAFGDLVYNELLTGYNELFEILMDSENTKFIKTIKFILNAQSSLKMEIKESNSNAHTPQVRDVGYDNTLTARLTKMDDFSSVDDGNEIMRVNFNTCVGNSNNCDHIFDILNFHKDSRQVNPLIDFDLLGVKILFSNIFITSFENITRLIRVACEGDGARTLEQLRKNFNEVNVSTNKIKHIQGYYRVLMIYKIMKKCTTKQFDKFFKVYGSLISSKLNLFRRSFSPPYPLLLKDTPLMDRLNKFTMIMEDKYINDYKNKITDEINSMDDTELIKLIQLHNIKLIIPGKGHVPFESKYRKAYIKRLLPAIFAKETFSENCNQKELVMAFKILLDFWNIAEAKLNE